jgi:uncharacterized membrane protein HdeD (DUF308 family)
MVTSQEQQQLQSPGQQPVAPRRRRGNLIGGVILIALGLLFLAETFIPGFSFWDYWPVLLVILGVFLLLRSRSS